MGYTDEQMRAARDFARLFDVYAGLHSPERKVVEDMSAIAAVESEATDNEREAAVATLAGVFFGVLPSGSDADPACSVCGDTGPCECY